MTIAEMVGYLQFLAGGRYNVREIRIEPNPFYFNVQLRIVIICNTTGITHQFVCQVAQEIVENGDTMRRSLENTHHYILSYLRAHNEQEPFTFYLDRKQHKNNNSYKLENGECL